MNRRKFLTALASLPTLAIPAAAIGNTVITELAVDARGVSAGSEAYVRAMKAADYAYRAAQYKRGLSEAGYFTDDEAKYLTADEIAILDQRKFEPGEISRSYSVPRHHLRYDPARLDRMMASYNKLRSSAGMGPWIG